MSLSSRVFEAQYAGPCANDANCDGIRPGDQVFFGTKEATVPQHLPGRCRYTDDLALKRQVCPNCFVELLPSGECPDECGYHLGKDNA